MNWFEKLAHKWFGWQYIMRFEGSSTGRCEILRAYPIGGMYFTKTHMGVFPLARRNMADTAFTLVESLSQLWPGSEIKYAWTPLTDTLLAHYKMMPEDPEFTRDASGTRTGRVSGVKVNMQNVPKTATEVRMNQQAALSSLYRHQLSNIAAGKGLNPGDFIEVEHDGADVKLAIADAKDSVG